MMCMSNAPGWSRRAGGTLTILRCACSRLDGHLECCMFVKTRLECVKQCFNSSSSKQEENGKGGRRFGRKKQNIETSQISGKVDVLHMRVFASSSR